MFLRNVVKSFSLNKALSIFFLATGEGPGPEPDRQQETTGLCRCFICTFDNDESLNACDICGVVRHPLVKPGPSNNNKTGIPVIE